MGMNNMNNMDMNQMQQLMNNMGMNNMGNMDMNQMQQLMNQMGMNNMTNTQMMNNPQMQMLMNQMQMGMGMGNMNNAAQMMTNLQNNMANNMVNNNDNNNQDNQNNVGGISVIFRVSGAQGQAQIPPVMIQCLSNEKVSEVIKKYRIKSGDNEETKKFIFNAKNLSPSLTVAEAGLTDNANIFVVATKGIKGAK